jgi:hypothetical protein
MSCDQFDSERHQLWQRDRQRSSRLGSSGPGSECVGLAVLLHDVERTLYHERACLLPNDCLTWMAVREVRVRGGCGAPALAYANTAVAELRYGMPVINFSKDPTDGWVAECAADEASVLVGRLLPCPRRTLQVLQQTVRKTKAFRPSAIGVRGHESAHPGRQLGSTGLPPYGTMADQWFPVPYLAFPRQNAGQLFWCATESGSAVGRDGRAKRRFNIPFRRQFCSAVAEGLPLSTSVGGRYVGAPTRGESNCRSAIARLPDVVAHTFADGDGVETHCMYLPRSADVLVEIGHRLEAGETWCRVINVPSARWRRQTTRERWGSLADVCGGAVRLAYLQQLWFESCLIHLPEYPQIVLVCADLAGPRCGETGPVGLWWDIAPAASYLDGIVEAATFPPVAVQHCNGLRMNISEVAIDARVMDLHLGRMVRRLRRGSVAPSRAA